MKNAELNCVDNVFDTTTMNGMRGGYGKINM